MFRQHNNNNIFEHRGDNRSSCVFDFFFCFYVSCGIFPSAPYSSVHKPTVQNWTESDGPRKMARTEAAEKSQLQSNGTDHLFSAGESLEDNRAADVQEKPVKQETRRLQWVDAVDCPTWVRGKPSVPNPCRSCWTPGRNGAAVRRQHKKYASQFQPGKSSEVGRFLESRLSMFYL